VTFLEFFAPTYDFSILDALLSEQYQTTAGEVTIPLTLKWLSIAILANSQL